MPPQVNDHDDGESMVSVPSSTISRKTANRHKNKHCLITGCDGIFIGGAHWSRHVYTVHQIKRSEEFKLCSGLESCEYYPKCSKGK